MKHPHRNPATRFGRNLHAELVAQDVSVRELARRMTPGGTEQQMETTRRHLNKLLSPNPAMAVTPGRRMVARVAEALNVLPEELAGDDSEDELVARLLEALERLPLERVVDALGDGAYALVRTRSGS